MNVPTHRITRRAWIGLPRIISRAKRLKRVQRAGRVKNRRKIRTRLKATAPSLSLTTEETIENEMLQVEEIFAKDPDRPWFHVMPLSGWMNDPNGPIYYRGRYHLFYQHVPNQVEWDWGLVWGHAVSEDLVTWEHLPIALEPSIGGYDSDGCFSGTCVKNCDGRPVILYTGVKLRSNHKGDLPAPEYDLNLPFIEVQLAAVPADPNDELMVNWNKHPDPILHRPPPNSGFTGWRDPFVYRRKDSQNGWLMLVGSGIKGKGGTVLKYTSDDILSDWKFDGYLCQGDADTGAMWECPLLTRLKPYQSKEKPRGNPATEANGNSEPVDIERKLADLSISEQDSSNEADERFSYFFCISPDAPTNPVLYWLGHVNENDVFCLDEARKFSRLDLGDILYAPNLTEDENGDNLLWGWLQERRAVGAYNYSGCLSVPRRLSRNKDKLFQEPAEQINQLRSEAKWRRENLPVSPDESIAIEGTRSQALDIEVKLEKGSSDAAGLLIRSWRVGGEGTAAIVFDWERSCLEVVFEALNPETMEFFLDADSSRRIGGPIDWHAGQPLYLRIILDHSCLEIFTGSGEVLSTRVYRGGPIDEGDSGLDFVSFGGRANLVSAVAYEMRSIWTEDAPMSPAAADMINDAPLFGMPDMGQNLVS